MKIGPTGQRIYELLVAAAEAGEPCPTNSGMAVQLERSYPEWVCKCLKRLAELGLISVEHADRRHRRITIAETGKTTDWTVFATSGHAKLAPNFGELRCPREWPVNYSSHNLFVPAIGTFVTPPTFVPRGEQ